jgi:signal transduction histidine kinase
MTFQRKLLLGFSLMALPALLIGAAAIRTNVLERRALDTLGQNMARNRTYAELENAMFNQSEIIWRYLTGMDPTAEQEFRLNSQVIDYWQQRWRSELRPGESALADGVQQIQQQIRAVAGHVFALYDSGQRVAAYRMAQSELRDRLLPMLANVNRDIYRRARESSVRGAYDRVTELVRNEGRAVLAVLILGLGAGLLASWLLSRELDAKIAQLERTQAQLLQSEKLASIGEMSAAVAHGLRNPLASLRAVAQLALHRTDSRASGEDLSAIIDEVDRLDRRVSHLLSFSRPAPFHPMKESVTRLLDETLIPFAELLRERRIDLATDFPAALPAVRVDPMQLEQALVEILSNARDAMPNGGQLRIVARAGPEGAGGITIEIADTGVGIPEEVLPSVCQPFVTTRPEGTGLGLAIAKRFIEQNGGRLEITSHVGTGTTVRVWLPTAASGKEPKAA